MSLITPKLCRFFSRRMIIFTGLIVIGFSNALMGSSHYLSLSIGLGPTVTGLFFLGVSSNLVFVTFMPELVDLSMSKVN
jgi:Na+/melibiose symporter-like transporter